MACGAQGLEGGRGTDIIGENAKKKPRGEVYGSLGSTDLNTVWGGGHKFAAGMPRRGRAGRRGDILTSVAGIDSIVGPAGQRVQCLRAKGWQHHDVQGN